MVLPGGTPNVKYFRQPVINESLEEIYADIDAWTYEIFEGQQDSYANMDLTVIVPPLLYRGVFVKGLCFTRAADLLLARYPTMREYFVTIASSMWSSFPWSQNADAFFATYQNEHRNLWFRKTNPERASKVLIPLADADFTHEFLFQPVAMRKKTIDVLTVSRLDEVKNLPLLCKSVMIHSKKYRPIRMTIVAGRSSGNFKDLTTEEQLEINRIEQELGGGIDDFIDLEANVPHGLLPHYYSSARATVLGSLIEGANRSLKESMSCNTPVICFQDFNRYTRGADCVFPVGAGLYSEFDAEALADVIHMVLEETKDLQPRTRYLQIRGRARMLNTCLDAIPYFQDSLPDYITGANHLNSWLNRAMLNTFEMDILEWIYAKSPLVHSIGLQQIDSALRFFLTMK